VAGVITEPDGEIVTTRYTPRALLDKLDELLRANPGRTQRVANRRSAAQPLNPDHEHEIIRRIYEKRDQPLVVRAEMQRAQRHGLPDGLTCGAGYP
jgi:hypothetical protein